MVTTLNSPIAFWVLLKADVHCYRHATGFWVRWWVYSSMVPSPWSGIAGSKGWAFKIVIKYSTVNLPSKKTETLVFYQHSCSTFIFCSQVKFLNCRFNWSILLLLLFSHSVMSDSLWPHGLKHARLSCPSPSLGACSNSCPLSWWCFPTISSSVIPFSCLRSFPASRSFLMSQLFTSGGQSIGALASVIPMTIQDWFPLGLTGLISLQSKGPSRVFSKNTTVQKHQFFSTQLSLYIV